MKREGHLRQADIVYKNTKGYEPVKRPSGLDLGRSILWMGKEEAVKNITVVIINAPKEQKSSEGFQQRFVFALAVAVAVAMALALALAFGTRPVKQELSEQSLCKIYRILLVIMQIYIFMHTNSD